MTNNESDWKLWNTILTKLLFCQDVNQWHTCLSMHRNTLASKINID